MSMKSNKSFIQTSCLVLIMLVAGHASAQGAGTGNYPMDFEQMKEMMRSQGMTPEQMKGFENVMGGVYQQSARMQAAELEREQQEFEAAYGSNPLARLDIDDKSYSLRVTECTKYAADANNKELFVMRAKQPPGEDGVTLGVNCCQRSEAGGSVKIVSAEGAHMEAIPENPDFDGQSYNWAGEVESERGDRPVVKIELSCKGLL